MKCCKRPICRSLLCAALAFAASDHVPITSEPISGCLCVGRGPVGIPESGAASAMIVADLLDELAESL